ncbi:hypothetical protein EGW08_016359 [Elysia chlorotica]|uniref:Uncharacterized protein n=1 Tax=Elysia chlorotica TaxID=188477 RepID=A0A433T2Z1_ELYCH|nr:hypothetical protein EGW08_016359 [Elysia chlorotica]
MYTNVLRSKTVKRQRTLVFITHQLKLLAHKTFCMNDYCFAVESYPHSNYEQLRDELVLPSKRKVQSTFNEVKKAAALVEKSGGTVLGSITDNHKVNQLYGKLFDSDDSACSASVKHPLDDTRTWERRKEKEAGEKSTPKPVETQKLPLTRERAQKDAEKREYNRLRQQNRRAKMSTQKKRRINEKRREIYAQRRKTPAAPTCSAEHPKARRRLTAILKEVSSAIGRSRTKFALFKKNFVHKLLARKDILSCKAPNSYYKRRKTNTNSLLVERFFENAGIDYPGKSGSSVPKKVLTKTMADLLSDFKTLHPGVKISLTTYVVFLSDDLKP